MDRTCRPPEEAGAEAAEREAIHGRSGAEGLATGGVEAAPEALAETQAAVEPLVPYLDTLRAVYARWDDWRRGAEVIGGVIG